MIKNTDLKKKMHIEKQIIYGLITCVSQKSSDKGRLTKNIKGSKRHTN